MRSIDEERPFFTQLLDMLESQMSVNDEIVLHDLTKGYDHTIVDIRNGHVTNRKVGDCGSNLGLEVLRGTVENGDRYNYVTHTREGKILRSSSMFIRDDDGRVIGSICINKDITLMDREDKQRFLKYLDDKGTFVISKSGDRVCEFLGISKFTLYNYLDAIRKVNGKADEPSDKGTQA